MINCIVVDDEPLATQLVATYISQIPGLCNVGSYNNPLDALKALNSGPVDLMFLDIEMPGITGIDFARSIKNIPQLVFITAHPQFAVEAFELEAVDYLVKPVSFERFLKTIQKIVDPGTMKANEQTPQASSLFIKVDKRLVKVNFADITYIEAMGDYLKVHTLTTTLITYMTIARLESLLPAQRFVRIHRSTIINTDFIDYIEGNCVALGKNKLAIGLTYKDSLLRRLG